MCGSSVEYGRTYMQEHDTHMQKRCAHRDQAYVHRDIGRRKYATCLHFTCRKHLNIQTCVHEERQVDRETHIYEYARGLRRHVGVYVRLILRYTGEYVRLAYGSKGTSHT